MATVLEVCTTEEQRSVVRFLWAKGLNAKDIHKEMFPVCGGKCLSRKAVRNLVDKFSQGHSKVKDDAQPGAEVAVATVKRLLCCGLQSTGKAMGQVYQCWLRICRETYVFFHVCISCFTSIWLSKVIRQHNIMICQSINISQTEFYFLPLHVPVLIRQYYMIRLRLTELPIVIHILVQHVHITSIKVMP
jgi:hypothetical protein